MIFGNSLAPAFCLDPNKSSFQEGPKPVCPCLFQGPRKDNPALFLGPCFSWLLIAPDSAVLSCMFSGKLSCLHGMAITSGFVERNSVNGLVLLMKVFRQWSIRSSLWVFTVLRVQGVTSANLQAQRALHKIYLAMFKHATEPALGWETGSF